MLWTNKNISYGTNTVNLREVSLLSWRNSTNWCYMYPTISLFLWSLITININLITSGIILINITLQFPWWSGQTWSKGLPADRAGHPEDESEDDGHRWSPLLLQEPQLQAVRRRRTAIRTEEMDPLFWGRHRHHLLRCHVWVRPSVAWGWDHGEENINLSKLQSHNKICCFF